MNCCSPAGETSAWTGADERFPLPIFVAARREPAPTSLKMIGLTPDATNFTIEIAAFWRRNVLFPPFAPWLLGVFVLKVLVIQGFYPCPSVVEFR